MFQQDFILWASEIARNAYHSGNEHHFLMSCKNIKLLSLRSKFFEDLYKINSSFKLFSSEKLFMYIMATKDESIMKLVAKFCFEVLTTFDSLLE